MSVKQENGVSLARAPSHPTARWLLLMPQVPDGEASVRVQVWRLLSRGGAVMLRHGVWLLPGTPERQQQVAALSADIGRLGAQCLILAASLVDGLGDAEVEQLFQQARTADYDTLLSEIERTRRSLGKRGTRARSADDGAQRRKLTSYERRLAELRAITYVATPRQRDVELALAELRAMLRGVNDDGASGVYRGRTWVTRRGVFVDRITSAWLIRRFIDPTAIFRFIDPALESVSAGELRFDIQGGEFGHEGDHCTFETLCHRFSLHEPGHRAIGEMVHDLDCRDSRYQRPETAGFKRFLDGVAVETLDDSTRIERASPLLDLLFSAFSTSATRTHPSPR